MPSGRSVGAPRGDSAVQSRRSGDSGHAAPKNRWLQDTRGPLPRARPMRETPQLSWVCAPGKNGDFSPPWGPQREKSPLFAAGLGAAPGGSCGRSAPLNRRCGGAAPAEGAAVPPWGGGNAAGCAEAAAAISRRTVPPMESTWNSPGRRGRAGKFSVSVRHGRDEAGLRPPLSGRGRGASEGLVRHCPQHPLPRGGCAARSRGGGGTRARLGAELHLLGAVVSLGGQSRRNRAITIEGADRSSSAPVLGRVPEAGILSLPLCPSTPRSLRGSASPPRSPEKGQQPCPVPSRCRPGLSRAHEGSLSPVAASPPEPPGKPCPVMNSMSNTSTRKLTLTGTSGVLRTLGVAAARAHPRSPLPGSETPTLPGSSPGGTKGCPCRRSEPLAVSPVVPELLGNEKGASRGPACAPLSGRTVSWRCRRCRGVPGPRPPPAQPGSGPWGREAPMLLRSATGRGKSFPARLGNGTEPGDARSRTGRLG